MTQEPRAYSAEQLGRHAMESITAVQVAVQRLDEKRAALIDDARKLHAVAVASGIEVPAEVASLFKGTKAPRTRVGRTPDTAPRVSMCNPNSLQQQRW